MKISSPFTAAVFLIGGMCACPANAQRGFGSVQSGSTLFNRYPFDKWAAENARPQVQWSVRIGPAHLSPHQRMIAQVHITVDAGEIRRHAGSGPILVFVRIEAASQSRDRGDPAGRRYQTGSQTPLSRLHRGDKFLQLDYDASAFVLPGDYVVSLAVCDGQTLEHTFVKRNLHVAEINPDPLPGARIGLPPVEFLPDDGNPEAWFLPEMRSRIRLPIETERPVRVELLVNLTPSSPESLSMFRQNMALILPSLKVLTGIDPVGDSIGLSLIDLNRRALSYELPDLRAVNWTWGDWLKLKPAFNDLSAATIDVRTLAGQRKMLNYFAVEAARLLGASELTGPSDSTPRVLIVLSAPVFFTHQEKPPPPDIPGDPSHRVFYISYSPVISVVMPSATPSVRSAATSNSVTEDGLTVQRPLYQFSDDLEHVLKPMGARVFRVSKAEEFRKALGAILDDIGKMPAGR